jgi:hypothetical protein
MPRASIQQTSIPMILRFLLVLGCSLALNATSAQPSEPRFRAFTVDADIEIGYGVAVADVDGDGQPDIVLADKRRIVWYRNPNWERFVMAENLTTHDNVCLAAADIDGDGRAEVAVGAGWNPADTVNSGAVFYLVPPEDRTQRWNPVQLHHEPTVHRMRWVRSNDGAFDLVVVPLHGRGNERGEGAGVRILAYRSPANPSELWTTRLIDDSLHLTHNFDVVPRAFNQPDELLVGGREGIFLFSPHGDRWMQRQLAANLPDQSDFAGVGEVRRARGYIATIEPMHGHQLVVYHPPSRDDRSMLWRREVLYEDLLDGHALACGDLLGAGTDQIIVGWRAMNRPGARVGIKLFTPLDAAHSQWRETVIDDNTMACEDLCLADLNGNGRLDIIAAGRATRNLKIYFNETDSDLGSDLKF